LKLLVRILIVAGPDFQGGDLVDDGLELALCLRFHHLFDDAHCPLPNKSSTCAAESAVRQHIIAVRFHDDHEVAVALNVEHDLGFALALSTDGLQRVDLCFARFSGRNTDANGAWELGPGGFERNDVADGELGVSLPLRRGRWP